MDSQKFPWHTVSVFFFFTLLTSSAFPSLTGPDVFDLQT